MVSALLIMSERVTGSIPDIMDVFSGSPFPLPLCFLSLSLPLSAATSACRASTRRSLSSTSLHAFCPTGNTKTESLKRQEVKTLHLLRLLLLLTCSSACRDSFIVFTSFTSLSSPLEEKNLDLEQDTKLQSHEQRRDLT